MRGIRVCSRENLAMYWSELGIIELGGSFLLYVAIAQAPLSFRVSKLITFFIFRLFLHVV